MRRLSQLVSQRKFRLVITRLSNQGASSGVDLPTCHTGPQGVEAGLQGAENRVERLQHIQRRCILTFAKEVPHALEIRAVAFLLDAQIDMDQHARLDTRHHRLGHRGGDRGQPRGGAQIGLQGVRDPVSYTHRTLPTIYLVYVEAVSAS